MSNEPWDMFHFISFHLFSQHPHNELQRENIRRHIQVVFSTINIAQ